ncbi:uncharacterized protein LOC125384266 [Haliotis rufescens]|uniref:uncharacterized protein LOC125384266 n=1 Tax=Haliotis rufescens TaxID=6454 RepID=UPI00201FADEF|nr:uncharacterized protein LOC125384266 [Haliotis rufescens]
MATPPRDLHCPLSNDRHSKHRSVRHISELPAADLHLAGPGSGCCSSRRLQCSLGGIKSVRFSASGSPSKGSSKDKGHLTPDTDFGRALVAGQKLVCRPPKHRQRQPSGTSGVAQPSAPPTQSVATPKPRLAHLQKALGAKGYSTRAAKAIALVHQHGDYMMINGPCSRHSDKHQDPMTVSPQFLAEFLLYLRSSRRLKGSTISTYLVAINSVLAIPDDWRMTNIPELQALLRSFRLEDQKAKFRLPAWDLNVVLKALWEAPFEPLHSSSFYDLAKKTVFLLALAPPAQVSELHALDVSHVRFEHETHGAVHLGLHSGGRIYHGPSNQSWKAVLGDPTPVLPATTFMM